MTKSLEFKKNNNKNLNEITEKFIKNIDDSKNEVNKILLNMDFKDLKVIWLNELFRLINNWQYTFFSDYNTKIKQDYKNLQSMNGIDIIKTEICEVLGVFGTFSFLIEFIKHIEWDGKRKYKNLEKGLLIIYEIIKGLNTNDMNSFIGISTYNNIKAQFFNDEKCNYIFEKWYNYKMKYYFTSPSFRLISKTIYNTNIDKYYKNNKKYNFIF